ncbi:MAG: helix-turn-helix domain-containing protein, partial [Pseudonocardiaceae bacterium]
MPEDHGRKRPTRPVPKPNAAQFTDALRRLLRHEARLKVETIAAATKMSNASVSRYVRGQLFPPSDFVDNAVTAALERLNGNSTYVTVDVHTELRYWQTAWVHAERTRHSTTNQQSRTPSDAEPAAPSAPLHENGWRKVWGAAVTIGSAIAAAYTSARIGVSTARS